MDLIYLIGAPGAGKSTVLELALAGRHRIPQVKPLAHDRLPELYGAVLGKHRPPFSGTDTLPMNVARTAEAWIATRPAQVVFGEGDRLAYGGWFKAAADAGYRITAVLLDVPDEVAAFRRSARAAEHNLKMQNPQWAAGRATKARRLAKELDAIRLDGSRHPVDVVQDLLRVVPAFGRPSAGHESHTPFAA